MEVVNTTTTTDPVYMYNNMNSYISNPIVILILFLIITFYFVFFSSLGNNNLLSNTQTDSTGGFLNFFTGIILFVLIMLILVNALQYFFSINVVAYVKDIFTDTPSIDVVVNEHDGILQPTSIPEIKRKKQVFNIPGNYYSYDNAVALCKAYDARLANYEEVENSYRNGGEWCNYGWSQGQMALFPTQKATFNNLQKIKGHEHDCGRPGVNGGYIANPNVKFGVNCYGYKPQINSEEEEMMKIVSPYPQTVDDIKFQKKVDYYKTKINNILLSPFNYSTWSN